MYGEKDDLKYCNFTIAINDQHDKDKVEYVRVSAYDKRAEACRDYLKKGSQISVEGNVKANGYIDKNGKARASININADDVKFLSRTKPVSFTSESGGGSSTIKNAVHSVQHFLVIWTD